MNWEQILVSLFPLFFAMLWLIVSHVVAWMGGWTQLARQFPWEGTNVGDPIRRSWFQSGSFGMSNYNSCLNVGIYDTGIRLSVLWLFRAGHPPLFIPWSDLIEPREKRLMFLFKRLEARAGDPPVKVLLPVWVLDYIPVEEGSEAASRG